MFWVGLVVGFVLAAGIAEVAEWLGHVVLEVR